MGYTSDITINKKQENIGVIYAILAALLWGLFPVLVNHGVQTIPPLTFAALSVLIAALGAFIYALLQGKLKEFKNKNSYFPLLMITVCIVIIPYTLFFIGAKMTSGVNTSMLLLAEIIFTLIVTPLIGEKNTSYKILGAGGVFLGALFIMYNGTFSLNFGDILIILSTVTYPIGNFYAKKALNLVSPTMILLVRSLFGGLFLLGLALIFEKEITISNVLVNHWVLILFNGLVLLGLSKIIWYECLKRLDISKAISITMTYPLFSLITLIIFFGEKISTYQWIGIIIMMVGVYYSIRRRSVDPKITKYSPL